MAQAASPCPAQANYHCASGQCASQPYLCSTTVEKRQCAETLTPETVVCPQGYCVKAEMDCMRKCGTSQTWGGTTFTYNTPCPAFADKCLPAGGSCPTLNECQNNNKTWCVQQSTCVDNPEYCVTCSDLGYGLNSRGGEFRCENGRCYHPAQHCNGIQFCLDGRDEVNCDLSVGGGGSAVTVLMTVIPILAVIGIFVFLVVWCFKARIVAKLRERQGRQPGQNGTAAAPAPNTIAMTNAPAPLNAPPPSYSNRDTSTNQTYAYPVQQYQTQVVTEGAPPKAPKNGAPPEAQGNGAPPTDPESGEPRADDNRGTDDDPEFTNLGFESERL